MSNQSLLSKIPNNKSLLQSTKYSFVIPSMPFLNFFVQTATIPTINTSTPQQNSPFAAIYRHGDTLVYDMLVLSFLLDEDMRTYEELHDWLVATTKPQEFNQYKRFYSAEKKLYHDGILTIHSNNSIPNLRFQFKNMTITSLGQVSFSTMENSQVIMSCDATFQYDYFDITRI